MTVVYNATICYRFYLLLPCHVVTFITLLLFDPPFCVCVFKFSLSNGITFNLLVWFCFCSHFSSFVLFFCLSFLYVNQFSLFGNILSGSLFTFFIVDFHLCLWCLLLVIVFVCGMLSLSLINFPFLITPAKIELLNKHNIGAFGLLAQ